LLYGQSNKRHHTIVVIEEDSIENRLFADWSMGFRNVESEDLKHVSGFSDLGSDAFWENTQAGAKPDALELLKSFYDGA